MKRHRQQKGSLWKFGGWWYLRFRDNERQPDGTIKRVQKAERLAPATGDTRSKQSQVLLDLIEERMAVVNRGSKSTTPLALMTITEFVEQQYLPYQKKELRPTSYSTRDSIWRNQLKPRVGHIKLRDFRTSNADDVLQQIADEGRVHRNYIRAIKMELSSIFRYAQRKDAITAANPITAAVIPKAAKDLEKRGTYVLADIMRMLAALGGTAKAVVATAAFSGLRRGELQALEWSDYDGKQLLIQHNISQGIAGEVKTEGSKAPVPVIPYLRKILDQHRVTCGSCGKFVFADERGDWLRLGHFARNFIRPVLEALKIRWHGWHGFRRGLATNLHDLKVDDKTIQTVLRHANVRITQDTYIKTLSQQAVDAMQQLEAAISLMENGSGGNCAVVVKQTIQ